ncbi:hypothetical protein FGL85_10990 [Leuconostoc pseudomesenteroides]|uniref:XRE family transcriptional regulator n=1 Tax=Leuconostoc pseudomesenteroides TaxID=33968 RepID=A0A5B8T1F3_LEUPS|nr:hypothetical protein [Leuconostoc pseudomesenteroides]QEA42999.1 hypothetical protein FGL85_10990 [Leuconostoc pseudomesenteroides]
MIIITEEKLVALRQKNGEFNKTKTDTAKYIGIERKTFQRVVDGLQSRVNKNTYDKLEKWLNS